MGLSYRVRDGTGRFPHAITTGNPATNPCTVTTSNHAWGDETMGSRVPWTKLYYVTNHYPRPTPYTSLRGRVAGGGLLVVNHMVDANITFFE